MYLSFFQIFHNNALTFTLGPLGMTCHCCGSCMTWGCHTSCIQCYKNFAKSLCHAFLSCRQSRKMLPPNLVFSVRAASLCRRPARMQRPAARLCRRSARLKKTSAATGKTVPGGHEKTGGGRVSLSRPRQ